MAKATKPKCKHTYGTWSPLKKSLSGLHVLVRSCIKCGEERRKLSTPAVLPENYWK